MRRGAWGALSGVTLLVCLAVGWLLADDPTPDPPPRSTDAARPETGGPGTGRLPVPPPAEAPAPVALEEPPGDRPADPVAVATATLHGRVLRSADGTPVAGVRVTALAPRDEHLALGTSDPNGHYSFELPGDTLLAAVLAGSGPDTVGVRVELARRLPPGAACEQDLLVGRGGSLRGWVVDERGRPVPGAEVFGWNLPSHRVGLAAGTPVERRTLSSADGEFTLTALGPEFTLAASAPGHAALKLLCGRVGEGVVIDGTQPSGTAPGGPGEPSALTIVLSPARTIRGRVVDERGLPLAGATVMIPMQWNSLEPSFTTALEVSRCSPPVRRQVSDSDGSFAFEDCGSAAYLVNVRHPGHLPWEGSHQPGDPELLVTLANGAHLSGRLLSAVDQRPLAGARVRAIGGSEGGMSGTSGETETDADGRFVIGGLQPTGQACVAALAEGHSVHVVEPIELPELGADALELLLPAERTIAGVVVDGSGAPLADVPLSIEGDRIVQGDGTRFTPLPTWERRFWKLDRTTSDTSGRFRFGQLYDGQFKLRAEHPLDASVFVTSTTRSGESELRLVLDTGAMHGVTFTGTVRDAVTRQPIPSFNVTPNARDAHGDWVGFSRRFDDPQGAFRIGGLEPGTMMLFVDAPGYMLQSFGEQEYAAGEHVIEALLEVARTVELRVLDRQRRPVSADLLFLTADEDVLWVQPGQGISSTIMHTNEDGWGSYRNLPAEQLVLEVRFGMDLTPQRFPLDLRTAPLGPLEFVLDRCLPVDVHTVVVGGTPELAAALEHAAPEQAEPLLMAAFTDGKAWPLGSACRLEARAPDGRLLAEHTFAGPGPHEAWLDLPEEPLELRFTAEGYTDLVRRWVPPAAAGTPEGAPSATGSDAAGGQPSAGEQAIEPVLAVLLRR